MQRAGRRTVLLIALPLIPLIALTDWLIANNIPLGFLYLIPMILLGRVLRRWQTGVVAAACTLLAELFDPFLWDLRTGLPRDVLYFAAFFTIGIFVYTSDRSRREIERQRDARRQAEEQLQILIESSPAAIFTTDAAGDILMANDAADRLLAVPAGGLIGLALQSFFPALAGVASSTGTRKVFRAVMQARGYRADGETFLGEICFSTYGTESGARLAAMVLDASEELRTREESSLHQTLAGSRIAVAAVSHEIRNVCGAISVVHQNLLRGGKLARSKDFDALGSLVLALERIAGVDLQQYPEERTEVDVAAVLDNLKIVIAPSLEEHGIEAHWSVDGELPPVLTESANLMQIFLNLANNSLRALGAQTSARRFEVSARREGACVEVRFVDSGGGVAHPQELFRPFQPGAHKTGLGLYLSRAFARSFGGDLRYEPLPGHACFVVELPAVSAKVAG